jgi:ubiquinone/menaquinone biosynthesis C-methylase UbiE
MGRHLGKSINVPNRHRLSLDQWHQRFTQQAGWTEEIRRYLFSRAKPHHDDRVLEVGSGTGAILETLAKKGHQSLIGIDIDHPSLTFSKTLEPPFSLAQADGHQLPFANETVAISLCHYLLLWVQHPGRILAEMRRVTRVGGFVIALAEPDYQARIDHPPPLDQLGKHQTRSLASQGADITMGRQLRMLFYETGLRDIETGILGAQWQPEHASTVDKTEWMTIRADLAGQLSTKEISHYYQIDQESCKDGNRVLFIPTFYAIGTVP